MKVLVLLSATVVFLMDKVMRVHITTEMYVSPEKNGDLGDVKRVLWQASSCKFWCLGLTYKGQLEQSGTKALQCVPVFGTAE